MSGSKVKGQGHQGHMKNCSVIPLTMRSKGCAIRRTLNAAADDTIALQPGVTGSRQYTLTAVCGSGLRGRGRPPVLRRWENQRMLSRSLVWFFHRTKPLDTYMYCTRSLTNE